MSIDLKSILLVAGVHFLRPLFPCVRVCQWKPFWIQIGDSYQKAYLEEWIRMANIPTLVHNAEYKDCTTIQKRPEEAPSASRSSRQASGEHGAPTWKISGIQGTASFWERAEAPLPPPRPRCDYIHLKQLSPFPERLKWPFSSDEILSGYEDSLLRHRPVHYVGENRP